MHPPEQSLQYLLDPVRLSDFFAESWEKRPLLIRRNSPDYFSKYFSMNSLESVLTTSKVNPTDVRVFRAGSESEDYTYRPDWATMDRLETHGAERLVDARRLYALFESGSTITLNQLGDYWGPLADLCRDVESFLQCKRVNSNAYLSPRDSLAWGAHYDLDDVFVMQIDGAKVWRVYESPIELPYRHQFYVKHRFPRGKLLGEWTLQAGDSLYLPRGFLHEPFTTDRHSLHVTITSFAYTWTDLIEAAVTMLGDADVRLRRALPFQNPMTRSSVEAEGLVPTLAALLDPMKDDRLVEGALQGLRARPERRPPLRGELAKLIAAGNVDGETVVCANRDLQPLVEVEDDQLTVGFDGRVLHLPTYAKRDVDALLECERVRVRDVPGEIDEAGKVTLVRRLLAEGLVRLAR